MRLRRKDKLYKLNQVRVGDIYEDCNKHPVLCTESTAYDVSGYSLFDGSYPRGCSKFHCALKRMSASEVARRIRFRDQYLAAEQRFIETMDPTVYLDVMKAESKDNG